MSEGNKELADKVGAVAGKAVSGLQKGIKGWPYTEVRELGVHSTAHFQHADDEFELTLTIKKRKG